MGYTVDLAAEKCLPTAGGKNDPMKSNGRGSYEISVSICADPCVLHYAVDHAQPGDLIAVIGKGHETYRDRLGVKTPFLERELLEEYARQIGLE